MIRITSRSNPIISEAAQLKDRKYREISRAFMCEGIKLLREAALSGADIRWVFALPEKVSECERLVSPGTSIYEVTEPVFDKLTTEKSPEGIVFTVEYMEKLHRTEKVYGGDEKNNAVLLCSVRDPGNVGTMIRSAAAFGAGTLILSGDCADIYNPRTIRASMGAVFRQKTVVCEEFGETVSLLRENGWNVYAAVLDKKSVTPDSIPQDEKAAFIIGNEGSGIPAEIAEAAGHTVYIPICDGAESLNAAVAAAVLMYERSRGRILKK